MKTKLYLLFFFVFPLFMSACRGDDPIPDPPVDGKRTVLVYMAADNSINPLASFTDGDLEELKAGMASIDNTSDMHLLVYYTGITRTAKGILAEIVRSMFLNSSLHLGLLEEMKAHALDMAEAIQRNDFKSFGTLVGKTWMQKKALDSGTNPPAVEDIIRQIKDYTLGYKLPGAGGGGYLYMVAKDPQAALRIRETLTLNVPNPRARFVEMSLSDKGFQVSRS